MNVPEGPRSRPASPFPWWAGGTLTAGAGLIAGGLSAGIDSAWRWLVVFGVVPLLGGLYSCLTWCGVWAAMRRQAQREASFRPAAPVSPPPGPAAQAAGTREWLGNVRRARLIRATVWLVLFAVSVAGLCAVFAWSFQPAAPDAAPSDGPSGPLEALALLLYGSALLGLIFGIMLALPTAPRVRRLLARSGWQEASARGITISEVRTSPDGPNVVWTVTRVTVDLDDGQAVQATITPVRSGVRHWDARYTRLPVPPDNRAVSVWVTLDGSYGAIAPPGGAPVMKLAIRP